MASVSAEASLPQKVKTFPVDEVRLTSGVFKHAEDLDISYLMGLNPDRLLAPYMKEAGLKPNAENYPNWENTLPRISRITKRTATGICISRNFLNGLLYSAA